MRVLTVLAWALTALVAAVLSVQRYRAVVADPSAGHDLGIFVDAATLVRAGTDPYTAVGYVYPPPLAVLLAPLADLDLLGAWTVTSILALLGGIAAVLATVWSRTTSWERPLVALLAVVTMLWSHPVSFSLWLGQTDALVFLALALAALAGVRGRPGAAGAALAVAAAVKTWPALVGVWVLRRGAVGRLRTVVVAVAVFAGLVALACIPLGPGAVGRWVDRTLSMSDQPLAAYSVWGVGRDLFADSGVLTPVAVAPVVGTAITVVLVAWVATLLVVALRRPGDPALGLWHVVGCVLLLLPVSHVWYLPMTLPVLWVWAARRPRVDVARWAAVLAVLLVCWWCAFRTWAGDPRAPETTGYVVVVAAQLVALTVSVLASRSGRGREAASLPA
ncbi:hypothetical protein I598_3220 [Isoptericola dokdonensis DS-3]|uniref:Polyprenol-phosphate-mannose-dependent alpha-(1-2)-phosphatidylinositol mannoside mannosyltransferase n=1 Tax=Isoptericola dokdonensis DS-3 TaxID=1300344 RepID=A0A168FYF8_9MICO|nr:hypothetical protein I598_3220 [Isoptericola dokdonensis DS-3]